MEFKTYIMEDVLESIIDYRGRTPEKSESGIPTLSAKSVKNNFIDYEKCYYISPEEYKKFMVRGFPEKGDILLTTEAPLGNVARLDRNNIALAQRLLALRGRKNILDNDYLLYFLQSDTAQHLLQSHGTGTTVTGIKQSVFRKLEISIPSIEYQRKISAVLRPLDDKIELNNRINKNLEEQAEVIFNNMFPDVLDETGTDKLEKIISFSNGRKRPSEMGNIPVFGGNGILAYTNKSNSGNCVIIGRVGAYCGNVSLSLDDCWISDNAISAKCKITESQSFIFNLLKNADLSARYIGTGQPLITQGILKSISCNIPETKNINHFEDIVKPLYEMIKNNSEQIKKLSALRDALLPQLLNGRLNI
ncbi:MAG: restriction endonuclease subunit S [Ruminococcus sp.]|nr:restriction endonuclease subunit S [Ruminococcus sp.]